MALECRQRMNELFFAALEREPETRLSILESACGSQEGSGYVLRCAKCFGQYALPKDMGVDFE